MTRRIEFINPFGTPAYNAIITETLMAYAAEGSQVAVTSLEGCPPNIDYYYNKHLMETVVFERVMQSEAAGYDAVVVGCCYDPGVRVARELGIVVEPMHGLDDVVAMVRKVFAGRVSFHDGVSQVAPGITVHKIGGADVALVFGREGEFGAEGSRVRLFVIPTNEELAIARAYMREASIIILDEAKSKDIKTGALAKQFGKMKLGRALVVDGEFDKNFQLSARNLADVALLPVAVYACEAPSGAITFYNAQAAELRIFSGRKATDTGMPTWPVMPWPT